MMCQPESVPVPGALGPLSEGPGRAGACQCQSSSWRLLTMAPGGGGDPVPVRELTVRLWLAWALAGLAASKSQW